MNPYKKMLRHMKTYQAIIILSTLIGTTNLLGQSQYDVVVSSSFTPSIKNTQEKIMKAAVFVDTTNIETKVEYNIEDLVYTFEYRPEPIKAPKVGKDQITRLYRNYVKAGFGWMEPYVEFSHSNLRSKNYAYGLNVKHHSFFGKLKSFGPASFSQSNIDMYGQMFLNNYIINANVDYQHHFVHSYGYNTDSLKKIFGISDIYFPKAKEIARHYQTAHANVSAMSNYGTRSNKLTQIYSLDYDFLFDNFSSYEHQLQAKSTLFQKINIARLDMAKLGGNMDVNYYHNKWALQDIKKDRWLFNLRPNLQFAYHNFSFRIGFDLAMRLQDSAKFAIYPNIEALLNVVPNILTFYVGVDGGMKHYSYLESMRLNPFLSDYLDLGFVNQHIRLYAGTKTNLSHSLFFGAGASLSLNDDMPFFFNDTSSRFLLNDTAVNLYNTFLLVKSQSIHTNAHLNLTYTYKNIFNIALSFEYNLYSTDSIKKAWYKPLFISSLEANYNLKDKFLFSFDFYIHSGAYYPSMQADASIKSEAMKSVFDFNIGCEYRWNKRLSFFLDLNNFAAQRNYFYYNYPSERINFLLGVKYIFGGELTN